MTRSEIKNKITLKRQSILIKNIRSSIILWCAARIRIEFLAQTNKTLKSNIYARVLTASYSGGFGVEFSSFLCNSLHCIKRRKPFNNLFLFRTDFLIFFYCYDYVRTSGRSLKRTFPPSENLVDRYLQAYTVVNPAQSSAYK